MNRDGTDVKYCKCTQCGAEIILLIDIECPVCHVILSKENEGSEE